CSSVLRREFLRAAAVSATSASALATLLGACTRASTPVARTATPVSPLESGLPVERDATLPIYEWKDYLAANALPAFLRPFAAANVDVEVESFERMDEAVARLQ